MPNASAEPSNLFEIVKRDSADGRRKIQIHFAVVCVWTPYARRFRAKFKKHPPIPFYYRLKQNEYGGETVRRSCLLRAAIVDSGQSVTLLSWGSLFNFKNVTSSHLATSPRRVSRL